MENNCGIWTGQLIAGYIRKMSYVFNEQTNSGSRSWESICSNSVGDRLAAVDFGGLIYTASVYYTYKGTILEDIIATGYQINGTAPKFLHLFSFQTPIFTIYWYNIIIFDFNIANPFDFSLIYVYYLTEFVFYLFEN